MHGGGFGPDYPVMQSTRFQRFPSTRAKPRLRFLRVPARADLELWVKRYGLNSSSYVLLEGSKKNFVSPRVDGFLAYQMSAGVCVIAGDPICPSESAPFLI